MSTSNETDSSDYIDESDCALPSGNSLRFIRAEHEISQRQQGWWKNRPQRPGQNEARRESWINRQINENSLFKWSSENHQQTVGGIEQATEQAKAERKRLEDLVNEAPPF
jgi:hypothetical protein